MERGGRDRGAAAAFGALHERHFGFRVAADAPLVVESLELEAVVAAAGMLPPAAAIAPRAAAEADRAPRRVVPTAWRNVPVYDRAQLARRRAFHGARTGRRSQRHDRRRARLARGGAR